MKSIILEIQEAAISTNVDVSGLLRKAKVAAVKLGEVDAVEWIDLELDGYDHKFDDLPKYRQAHGILKVKNPYQGLVQVHFENAEIEELLTRTPISDGVGVIQSLLRKNSPDSTLSYSMSNRHRTAITDLLNVDFEPILMMSKSQLTTILERVVSLVLNWSLALEKAGILGEGMSFSMSDKEKSKNVTQNFFAQNIGHVGDLSGSARATVSQSSKGDMAFDQRKIESLINQASRALPLLPESVRDPVAESLKELSVATSTEEKSGILARAKNVLEGASGNLAAEGILRLISTILG
jgi:AbiTii